MIRCHCDTWAGMDTIGVVMVTIILSIHFYWLENEIHVWTVDGLLNLAEWEKFQAHFLLDSMDELGAICA